MSGKRKYYPNNWQKYKDAPDDMFFKHTFIEIMDHKIGGWELPSNIACMIREENIHTRKVKEHVYVRPHAAENKVEQLMRKDDVEFTVCTPETIHFISNLDITNYEDPFIEPTDD